MHGTLSHNVGRRLRRILTTGSTEVCLLCGETHIPVGNTPGICRHCAFLLRHGPGPFTPEVHPGIVAARIYEGAVVRGIEVLKIQGHREIAASFARILLLPLYERCLRDWDQSDTFNTEPPVVVPVPGSVAGCRSRGFDQSIVLARELPSTIVPLVERTRGTTQKQSNRDRRRENAEHQYHGSRRVAARRGIPERAIIVDDVVTTGASVCRCGEILSEMGVREWRVIALAIKL